MKPLVCLGLLLLLTPYLATRTAAASPETPDDSSDLEQSPKEQVSSSERSSDSPQAHADIEVDTPRQASSEASSEEPSTPPLAKAGLSIEGPAGASLSGQAALTVEQPSAKASTSQEPAQSSPKETPSSPQEESSSSEESESGLPFRIVMNDGPSGEQAVRPPRMSGALDLSNIISINDAEESPATSEAASTVASEEKATAKPSHAAAPSAAHAPAAAKKTAASAAGAKPAAGSAAARAAQAAAARRARLAAMRRAAASGGASHTPTNKKVVPTMTQASGPASAVSHPVDLEDSAAAPASGFKEETPMWSEPDQADIPLPSLSQPQAASGSLTIDGKSINLDLLKGGLPGIKAALTAEPGLPSMERAASGPAGADPLEGFPTIMASAAAAAASPASSRLLTPQQVFGNFGRDVVNVTTKAIKLVGAVVGSPNTTYASQIPSEIRSSEDLRQLSEDQLDIIFKNGTAEIPGKSVGSSACTGEGLTNFATQDTALYGPNAPLFSLWRGKVFYTDPENPDTTKVWNLLNNNNTVMATAQAVIVPSYDKNDTKPSLVLDYGHSEAIMFRPLRDEIRKVGPSTYLGRAWVLNPVTHFKPTDPIPGTSNLLDTLEPGLNATFMAGLRTSGFEGPNSLSKEEGGWGRYEAGEPFKALWFSMDCHDDAVQRLHYSTVAQLLTALARDAGYQPANYTLPPLNDRPGMNARVDGSAIQDLNEAAAPSVDTIRQLVRGQNDPNSPTLAQQAANRATNVVQNVRNGDLAARVVGSTDNVVAQVLDSVRPAAGSVGNALAGIINSARPAGLPAIPSNTPGSALPSAATSTAGR